MQDRRGRRGDASGASDSRRRFTGADAEDARLSSGRRRLSFSQDQLRALSLRAFARAKAQGVRPTRVRNKDPLKPLPVPGKFLRPIIDPERAPPRPADGIGI